MWRALLSHSQKMDKLPNTYSRPNLLCYWCKHDNGSSKLAHGTAGCTHNLQPRSNHSGGKSLDRRGCMEKYRTEYNLNAYIVNISHNGSSRTSRGHSRFCAVRKLHGKVHWRCTKLKSCRVCIADFMVSHGQARFLCAPCRS